MTITCSNCDMPFNIVTDDHIVACPYCGTRTFSPGTDDWTEDEDENSDRRAANDAAGVVASAVWQGLQAVEEARGV